MKDKRQKNKNWELEVNDDGTVPTFDAQLAVLMDIRDELQSLNRLLCSSDFCRITGILRRIDGNTARPRKTKKTTR